jgi:hypothetical protein
MENNKEEKLEKISPIVIESGVKFIKPKPIINQNSYVDRIANVLSNSRIGRLFVKGIDNRFRLGLAGYLYKNTTATSNLSPHMMISITRKIHDMYSHDFVSYYTGDKMLDPQILKNLNDALVKLIADNYTFNILIRKEIALNTMVFIEEIFESADIQNMHTEASPCDSYIAIYQNECKEYESEQYQHD